jgi:hypothetical protein
MAISFKCSQCGNDYAVSDGLAGKSAICKACGARMTVPGGPGLAAEPSVDMPADVVGLDEPESVDPTIIAGAPRRPAARVFTPSPSAAGLQPVDAPKAPASGGGSGKLIRLLVIVAAVGVAIYSRAGRSTKTDVRAFHQQQVDFMQRINDTLKSVKDVPSAKAASGPLKQHFQEMKDFTEKNRNKKANKADVDAVEAEFRPREEALQKQLVEEMIRVAVIPGVSEALDLKSMPGGDDDAPDDAPDKPSKKD